MAHKRPFDQLTGPVTVWVALWTDTLEIPEVDTTPSAPWAELGDTDGDQSVHHGGALTYFRDNAYQGPRKVVRPEETVEYGFTLVGLTVENYAQIMSAVAEMGEATTTAGNGTRDLPMERGFAPPRYALLFRGEVMSPYGPYPAQYVAEEGVFDGEPMPVFARDARPMIDVEFIALEDLGYLTVQLPDDIVLVATSKGLYQSADFVFDASEPTWQRLGGDIRITRAAYDHDDPVSAQLAVAEATADDPTTTSIYLRRPSVSDSWVQILTMAEAFALSGFADPGVDEERFVWVEIVDNVLYVTWEGRSTTGKYVFVSSDWGDNWTAVDPSVTYGIGDITSDSNGKLYLAVSDGSGSRGRIYSSSNGGASWVEEFKGVIGGWLPVLFVDRATDVLYAGRRDTDTDPRLIKSPAYEDIDDITDPAGMIYGSTGYYEPGGVIWARGDYLRTLQAFPNDDNRLYISDDGGVTWSRVDFPDNLSREMTGTMQGDDAALIIARLGADEENPHTVVATTNNGATLWNKGGANADQTDGGGDSIPYTASVAWNGIRIV